MKFFKKSTAANSLRQQAERCGACQEGLDDWTKDKDGLCERYYRYIDFCIKHNLPAVDFIKEQFAGVAERHGIFANSEFSVSNLSYLSPLGMSCGDARYDQYGVGCIYLRHHAKLRLHVCDQAVVRVYLYDHALLEVSNTSKHPVYIYKYGGEVAGCENTIIRDRERKE